jgi:hypothetical protein
MKKFLHNKLLRRKKLKLLPKRLKQKLKLSVNKLKCKQQRNLLQMKKLGKNLSLRSKLQERN